MSEHDQVAPLSTHSLTVDLVGVIRDDLYGRWNLAMTAQLAAEAERATIARIAEEYRQQGFQVVEEPSGDTLPDFLRPFRPDLLVDAGDRKYVVEVHAKGSPYEEGYFFNLASTVEAHPDWHLRMVLVTPEGDGPEQVTALPDRVQLADRIAAVRDLASAGEVRAALLLAWSALEAAARLRLMEADQNPLEPKSTERVLSALVSSAGLLQDDDRRLLRRRLPLRNAVAHGYLETAVSGEDVEVPLRYAERLLET